MDNQVISGLKSYLTFKLGEEQFAVNIGHVKKILEITEITKVPHAPDYYLGVINLFGNVLPVIDGRLKFGLEKRQMDKNACIIVLMLSTENGAHAIGILVDQVLKVTDILDENLSAPPEVGGKFKHDFIQSIANNENEFIIVLNVEKLFSDENIKDVVEN